MNLTDILEGIIEIIFQWPFDNEKKKKVKK